MTAQLTARKFFLHLAARWQGPNRDERSPNLRNTWIDPALPFGCIALQSKALLKDM
jgi:hypothetical protein